MWDPNSYDDTDYGLDAGESFEPADAWDTDLDVPTDGPHVMSVLGPITPDHLGICLTHTHLLCDPPALTESDPDYRLDDEDKAEDDIEAFVSMNGRSMVECSTRDYGRNAAGLVRIAGWAPVHLIAVTGRHAHLHAARLADPLDVESLAREFMEDLTVGMDGTAARAGVIMIGTSLNEATDVERAAIIAAGTAHRQTGAPVTTHTEQGSFALQQLALLREAGVPSDRVIVGHLDRHPDVDAVAEVGQTGAFLSIDQIGKNARVTDQQRAELIRDLVERGYENQILLSMDYGRRSLLSAWGGTPGLAYLQEIFMVQLMMVGLEAMTIRKMVIENPARALTILPPPRADAPR